MIKAKQHWTIVGGAQMTKVIPKNLAQQGFTQVVLLSALIPKSYDAISSGTNTFILSIDSTTATVTLPVGRYNARSLRLELQTALNAAAASITTSPAHGITFTVSFPSSASEAQTGKFTFSAVSNAQSYAIQFVFPSVGRVPELCGFAQGETTTEFTTSLVSSNVINVTGESSLFVYSDICSNNGLSAELAAIFSGDADGFGFIRYNNPDPFMDAKMMVDLRQTNVFSFTLLDEDGAHVDLNGQRMVLSLLLFEPYDYPSMLRVISSILITQQQRHIAQDLEKVLKEFGEEQPSTTKSISIDEEEEEDDNTEPEKKKQKTLDFYT